jgi:hypothetical protein
MSVALQGATQSFCYQAITVPLSVSLCESLPGMHEDAITVFPIPFSQVLTICGAAGADAEVTGLSGKKWMQFHVTDSCEDIRLGLSAGVYVLSIKRATGVVRYKLICDPQQ